MEQPSSENAVVKASVIAGVLAVAGTAIAHDRFIRDHNNRRACGALVEGKPLNSLQYRAISGEGRQTVLAAGGTLAAVREACVNLGAIKKSEYAEGKIARSLILTAGADDPVARDLPRPLVADALAEEVANLRRGSRDALERQATSEGGCIDNRLAIAADLLGIARDGERLPRHLVDKLFAPCPVASNSK